MIETKVHEPLHDYFPQLRCISSWRRYLQGQPIELDILISVKRAEKLSRVDVERILRVYMQRGRQNAGQSG